MRFFQPFENLGKWCVLSPGMLIEKVAVVDQMGSRPGQLAAQLKAARARLVAGVGPLYRATTKRATLLTSGVHC
jgi:hypothetical protein